MQDDHDILGKADALLRRHVPQNAGSGEGADVPVLTELITPGGDRPATPDDEYKRKLIAEVVSAVQARLAQDLEHHLTRKVIAEVHVSVAAALGDIQQDIATIVADAVAEALARRPHR
jgi:hypothetical protein